MYASIVDGLDHGIAHLEMHVGRERWNVQETLWMEGRWNFTWIYFYDKKASSKTFFSSQLLIWWLQICLRSNNPEVGLYLPVNFYCEPLKSDLFWALDINQIEWQPTPTSSPTHPTLTPSNGSLGGYYCPHQHWLWTSWNPSSYVKCRGVFSIAKSGLFGGKHHLPISFPSNCLDDRDDGLMHLPFKIETHQPFQHLQTAHTLPNVLQISGPLTYLLCTYNHANMTIG